MCDTIIVWFRRDLRLHDNAALSRAREEGARIVPVYIFAPEEEEPWRPGAASRWWLHHSLESLGRGIRRLQSSLLVFRGDSLSVLMMLCERTGAGAVYWNRLYDPATVARDARIKTALRTIGIRSRSFPGYLVREPWEVMTGGGTPYMVFAPYARASRMLGDPVAPLAGAGPMNDAGSAIRNDGIESLRLRSRVRWDTGFSDHWEAGEPAAWRRVARFVESGVADYEAARDRPGEEGISRLSPHLHFGEISPRSLWHAVIHGAGNEGRPDAARSYLRQLLWRDFAHQLLYHFPHISERNFKPAFDGFPWRDDSDIAAAWRKGETGVPLVDAGMRELCHTGYMHNRVRMVTASFLTKNAGIHWRTGAHWFWDTLVDANLANNTVGWQWVAGSGPDAAPYFRIFNPVAQGQRFDPRGQYVRRWIPEIAGLPDKHIHDPWTAPGPILTRAGIQLGKTYPEPAQDLKQSRLRALEAYKRCVAKR